MTSSCKEGTDEKNKLIEEDELQRQHEEFLMNIRVIKANFKLSQQADT